MKYSMITACAAGTMLFASAFTSPAAACDTIDFDLAARNPDVAVDAYGECSDMLLSIRGGNAVLGARTTGTRSEIFMLGDNAALGLDLAGGRAMVFSGHCRPGSQPRYVRHRGSLGVYVMRCN